MPTENRSSNTENLPCPFCAGRVDPEGWLRGDGARGPECESCGATAPNLELWNGAQPAQQRQGEPVALAIPNECPHIIVFDDADRANEHFCGTGARPAALRRFEQISQSWNAHMFVRVARNSRDDRYPSATAVDPAEVERWKATAEHFTGVSIKATEEAGMLRAQLAEAQALLAQVVNSGVLSSEQYEALEAECCAISVNAPKCKTCHDQGEVFVRKADVHFGMQTEPEPVMAQCPECAEPSAPVERDERAKFDAWFKGHSKDWPFPSESIKAIARDNDWLVWQARAALERKP